MPSTEILLGEARCRVAEALGVDVQPWSAEEVKWIAREWGIFRHELFLIEEFGDEIMEMSKPPMWVTALRSYRAGWAWWLRDAPFGARLVLAGFFLFLLGFASGLS